MSSNPVLIAREGQLTGQRWIIENDEFIIGRGAECSLVLPERQVSRHHVRITPNDDQTGYILHDLGSKNGTHINGKRISGSVPLSDGDSIQVALSVTLMFVGTEATLPLNWEPPKPEKLLTLEEEKRTVIAHGKELIPPLSLAQFRLLKLLFDADGSVVDRDSIINAVWPDTEGIGVSEQAIDALMRRLRDRLDELDNHNFIVTVRGHGFRLDNPIG